jgi:hypothetical protein
VPLSTPRVYKRKHLTRKRKENKKIIITNREGQLAISMWTTGNNTSRKIFGTTINKSRSTSKSAHSQYIELTNKSFKLRKIKLKENSEGIELYLIRALQPMQLSCFFANFIMPLFEGVEIEIDLVWLPWSSSLLAFFKMGSKILRSGCNMKLLTCE